MFGPCTVHVQTDDKHQSRRFGFVTFESAAVAEAVATKKRIRIHPSSPASVRTPIGAGLVPSRHSWLRLHVCVSTRAD